MLIYIYLSSRFVSIIIHTMLYHSQKCSTSLRFYVGSILFGLKEIKFYQEVRQNFKSKIKKLKSNVITFLNHVMLIILT